MTDDEDDESLSLHDQFYRETISNLEDRKRLERVRTTAAHIEVDFERSGPLALYIKSRRGEAAEALRVLVESDPRDAVRIAQAQSTVHEYLRACDWVEAHIEAAAEADREIREGLDGEHEQD